MTVVVVAGALANKPGNGGEAWVRLSWLLGLAQLGVETWFVEQIDAARCGEEHVAWFERVTRRFGLAERSALLRADDGRVLVGPLPDALREAAASAELLLNVSGNLTLEPLLGLPRRRAYLDLDPGYTQLWHSAGALGHALARHEELLTVGLAVGRAGCRLPLDGRRWRPVPPPVVLAEWPAMDDEPPPAFTTVASWRGYGRVEHDGRLLGQKAHEFRRFAALPRDSGARFEAALDIHPDDGADARLLRDGGWRLVDPRAVAGDPDAFRAYVQRSPAEFSPAQGVYVETACGWLGDRTTRYLASGRPAVVQQTGLPPDVPLGEGLVAFSTPAEARAAIAAVAADYGRHARAARRLAEERFDAGHVVGALLEDLIA